MQSVTTAKFIQLDGWTAPNRIAFMGVVVTFLDPALLDLGRSLASEVQKGHLVRRTPITSLLLELVRVDGAHTGVSLANKLIEILDAFDLTDKVM